MYRVISVFDVIVSEICSLPAYILNAYQEMSAGKMEADT